MLLTNARFPIFVSRAHEGFPRDRRRGSQKNALWLGSRRGWIRISPATQTDNNHDSTCQPKWLLAPDDGEVGANPNCDKILSTLQRHWDLGQKIDSYCNSGAGHTIASFARQNRIPERTARIYFTFFWLFPEPELQKLKVLRRKTSDLPLNSGHVAYLLTIKTKVAGYGNTAERTRQKFAQEAAVNSYTPAQLNSAIKRVCGRSTTNKGRPFTVRDADVAVRQIAEDAVIWTKRCRATWETLVVRTPKLIEERKQLRSLIKACKQYFEVAEEIVSGWGKDSEIDKLTAKLEKAEAKIAKSLWCNQPTG